MADIVTLEGGWSQIQSLGIDRLEQFLETGQVPSDIQQAPGKPTRIFGANDYASLYTVVYNMCTQRSPHNWAEALYRRYGETLTRYLQQKVVPALTGKQGLALLEETLRRWQNHKMYVKWLDRFFAYLDRYYVKLQSVDPLNVKGVTIFRSLVFAQFKPQLSTAFLDFINEERETMEMSPDTLRGISDMFLELGINSKSVYEQDLEESLLQATASYYSRRASAWVSSDTAPEYCMHAQKAFATEERRVARYLQPSTWPKLKQALILAILTTPEKAVLEKETGPHYLLANDQSEDIKRMYSLFSMVDGGIQPIAAVFKSFVATAGNSIVESRQELFASGKNEVLTDPSFVEACIFLHDKYKGMVAECFAGDSVFQRSLKEAFESFINKDLGKFSAAAFLSSYCDRVFKKSGERLTDEAVELALTKTVDLFAYLTDKDMFAEIYRNQLSKRLLQESSASEDSEKALIQKLKLKCGAQFCTKLEGMLADMRTAQETQRDFREHGVGTESLPFEFSVLVLTTGYWPTYVPMELHLPREFTRALEFFSDYYRRKTDHRKLSWIHSLGMATVATEFGEKRYDVVMNTYQAVIVLALNSENLEFSVAELQKITGIEESFLRRLLATMTISKFKLLNKSGPNSKAVEADEKISINSDFSGPSRRIKLPPPTVAVEENFSKERVEEDRSITIQAAIVRIMKTRKTLNHANLVAELISQLSFFKPNPKAIKQQIEQLIEREYLARDEQQPNVYNYLA